MICPYCLELVAAKSKKHDGCKINEGEPFPAYYVQFHGEKDAAEPVVLSVVGSVGHGKTVFLCALFDFLDNHLTKIWPGFFNHVLDQKSLSRLTENRNKLRNGELPPPTLQSFPRPGIFRLTNIPPGTERPNVAPLEDTTVLIYDPPGEAFETDEKISRYAGFVRRSSCVLFLIDVANLGDSIPDKMAELLDTYILGMVNMGIERQEQHLIVVYTKSDDSALTVPEFKTFLAKHPEVKDYLDEQLPQTLADPHIHLDHIRQMSHLLGEFTRVDLNAAKFINAASYWFRSVNYLAVSSLGSESERENGVMKLKIRMSPRCVADPLLYVLVNSIKLKKPPTPWWQQWKAKLLLAIIALIIPITIVTFASAIYYYGFYNADFKRAAACEEEGDNPCALENYSRAIESNPDYAEAYSARGWVYFNLDRFDKAFEDCDRALTYQTDLAEALTLRGLLFSVRQDYQNTVRDCNRAIELRPEYAEAYECRATAYLSQKEFELAIKDCDKAIELKPTFARAFVTRGNTHLSNGNNAQALKDYGSAIAMRPNFVTAYESRGAAYCVIGNFDQSINDLTEAIKLNPARGSPYIKRGDAYLLKGDHQ